MSYGRPSPRPGELYNQYGPPRPPMGNAYGYSRSEAGGTRPGRPPQRYPAAEPYSRAASSRPAQRTPDYAGSSYEARGPPPPGRRYNNEPSRGYRDQESDYHSSYSRPSAMTDVRKPPSSATRRPDARDHHQHNPDFRNGPPRRGNRPITPEEYYSDPGEADQAQPPTQASTEAEGSWSWNNLKKTVWGNSTTDASQPREMAPSPEHDQAPGDRQQEQQNTIWAKLATVGATFQKKLHNDEGYASDASDYEGESHLIRIMKKHHIEKAESARDLPDWLFSDAELKEAQSRVQDSQYTNHAGNRPGRYESHGEAGSQRQGGRAGLDDIFAAVDEGRGGHARQDSGSTKHSQDSGYGSAEPARRRRGRYEDAAEYAPKAPPGRNRLEQMPSRHPPPAQRAYNPPPPSHHYDDRSRQYPDPRRYEGSRKPAPAPPRVAPPTTVDYFPPSGQNDRYPTPSKAKSPSYPSSSSTARRYAR
ncbi:hypothetical protein PTTG_26623 [Puccinia triticina 1-1 BBBD Race 1]|uniref:Mso1 N-terminal domain-containing protein n=2 Tax=Puccinia triticina TaxID=208348 RepID=A0A180GT26_PUCT1|nr:uncharacterized protein PtA15_10A80 [Puccinia triticina]OAV95452.1 hypothetical protein PTTG_26623 [Puccinia triticina 1-1 BBBD Race 1]WAQ88661.1 hypothetical protein PtA15_10A80 [Puccinia triticina]WAR58738.1 hypothetical protein PtB15_10B77 [Puccinia triticina]